jgi:nickel-dependent lactate racemase
MVSWRLSVIAFYSICRLHASRPRSGRLDFPPAAWQTRLAIFSEEPIMRILLAYGREGLGLELPDTAAVHVIEPAYPPPLADEAAALRAALRSPVAGPSLRQRVRRDDTVAVVFSDITRPTPNDRLLPPLLEELAAAGVADHRITLINALATHRPQTGDELDRMLGRAITARYRIVQHDAHDEAQLLPAAVNRSGRTVRVNRHYFEASVRILSGFIEPHLFAGFSGGPKAVLPGVADAESILDNHGPAMIAHPGATWAVTEGNPVWEEMRDVALATAPAFLLNVALDRARRITGVFAGDLLPAHRAGVEFVRRTALRPVPAPFDIVITTNSGYPLDLNLYQAVKGMSAAAGIVRPGGDILLAAECSEGLPNPSPFKDLLWAAASPAALLERIRTPGFRCADSWQAQILAQVRSRAAVHVYAGGLSDEEVRRAHLTPCRNIEATVARLLERQSDATIAVLPEGPQSVPFVIGG